METTTSKVDFILQHFGEGDVSRDGTNIAVKCPACGKSESKRKFSIRLDNWRCHCWVCGVKGKNLFGILKEFRGINHAKDYALKFDIKTDNKIIESDEIKRVFLPKDYIMIAPNINIADPDFRDSINYLRSRGVTDQKMWLHKIGTCISGGYWNRRVVFPSFDNQGSLNYYVSRSIDSEVKPKYVNAKADKKNIVFDSIRIDWQKELTLVEGVFDLIKCGKNATCILGSYMSDKHELFREVVKNNTPVLLALDDDVIDKTYKIAQLFYSYGINVRIMDTSGHDDVGEMNSDEFYQRSLEANNYTGDTRLSFLIDRIKSGSIF
jgi:hypothetical protein